MTLTTQPQLGYRWPAALGVVAAFGALAFAFFLQYGLGLEPCSLCWFQRYAMFAVGVVFLLGALHGPGAWGRWVYALGAALFAVAGVALASRHVWLQSLPPGQVPACAPSLEYLMGMLPWQQVISMVWRGDTSCATIKAAFLGLGLPAWTLLGFIALFFWGLAGPVIAKRKRS